MGLVSLNSSLRSNLLSLQQTAKLQELTQNRLSTGLRVNSAIDNPSSYYTAAALNNRASDLSALLDAMSQGIQTLKTAQQGLQTASTFLEQAASIANQALETEPVPAKEWFEQQDGVAAVVTNFNELKAAINNGKSGEIVIYGTIEAKESLTLNNNQNLVGVGYYGNFDTPKNKISSLIFDNTKNPGIKNFMLQANNNLISDLDIKMATDNRRINGIRTNGNLKINNLNITFDTSADPTDYYGNGTFCIIQQIGTDPLTEISGINHIQSAPSNNLTGPSKIISDGATLIKDNATLNINVDKMAIGYTGIIRTKLTMQGQSTLNIWNDTLIDTFNGGSVFLYGQSKLNIYSPSSSANIFNGATVNTFDSSTLNIQAERISAFRYTNVNFNGSSHINIEAQLISGAWTDAQFNFNINSANVILNTKSKNLFASSNQIIFNAVAGASWTSNGKIYQTNTAITNYEIPQPINNPPAPFVEAAYSDTALPNLEWIQNNRFDNKEEKSSSAQYNELLTQFDGVIKDSGYQGINLLQNNSLSVNFNEDRSSKLEIKGIDASSEKLGLKTKEWNTRNDIAKSLTELETAIQQIRSYTQKFGNYYSIVTTREDFTEKLINVLTEGADKLTLADMNEESANSLMLETRQNLAINALSLASQAGQSVLRLF